MYDPMPTTDIALLLRHGMLYKKLVASVTKMLDHYIASKYTLYIPDREALEEQVERVLRNYKEK